MTPSEPLNILLVDDNPDNHVAVSAALSGLGENIVCVDSGARALRKMLDEDYAFVLLDVNMPGMDGFEVARLMRQIQRLRDTPIIFLSATRNADEDQFRGYEAGAVDFISTPVSPPLLKAKVGAFARHCRLSQAVQRHVHELRVANDRLAEAIEQRYRVEAELVESRRLLELQNSVIEEGSRHKSEFLSRLAHELRTPLNAVLGFTGTLLMRLPGPLNEEQENQLRMVDSGARHMLAMVNELLDLARIESGKGSHHPEDVECADVLDHVAASLRPLAASKGLAFDVAAQRPLSVLTDRRALTQILLNLAGNAVKYTEAGSVRIDATQHLDSGEYVTEFAVADTGPGISHENQARLFQAFERLENARGQHQEGTGLGLHICQSLARQIGARLTMESEPGKGSTFRVSFSAVLPAGRRLEPVRGQAGGTSVAGSA